MESLFQIAVCSAPRLIRTCFELDFDETEATSRFFGFFKLDRRGPCALPKKSERKIKFSLYGNNLFNKRNNYSFLELSHYSVYIDIHMYLVCFDIGGINGT